MSVVNARRVGRATSFLPGLFNRKEEIQREKEREREGGGRRDPIITTTVTFIIRRSHRARDDRPIAYPSILFLR